jgi:hypothetical protein
VFEREGGRDGAVCVPVREREGRVCVKDRGRGKEGEAIVIIRRLRAPCMHFFKKINNNDNLPHTPSSHHCLHACPHTPIT